MIDDWDDEGAADGDRYGDDSGTDESEVSPFESPHPYADPHEEVTSSRQGQIIGQYLAEHDDDDAVDAVSDYLKDGADEAKFVDGASDG